jgi:spoIIIJ-associated protein
MESIEQTGRTVEEAVTAALAELGAAREEVDIEILSEESRGLLNSILGYNQAKVRVTLKAKVERAAPAPGNTLEDPSEEEKEEDRAPSPLAQRAAEVTDEILQRMGLEARSIIVSDDEEGVSLDIHSEEDLGLLIGKHGQTLAALQLIVALISNRELGEEERRRVNLDAEGYNERRERSLKAMARSAAQRAKKTGKPVPISSLNSRERRIVHMELANDPAIATRSEGEDPDRTIIVTAKRAQGTRWQTRRS